METNADPNLTGHSSASAIPALILEMGGFAGHVGIERLREEHGAITSNPVQLLQESRRARAAAEQTTVSSESGESRAMF
jgi:hypothetical protein